MTRLLRRRPSPALVIACIALFVSLGPAAYATHEVINGSDVVDNSLTGADVRGKAGTSGAAAVNGSLTTDDIAGQQANAANGTPFIDGTLTQWDIKNGGIAGADIALNAINGTKVASDSLSGADIEEASLGQVPAALLGGIGRYGTAGSCDPESSAFVTCASTTTTVDVPVAQARMLVIGTVKAQTESGTSSASGHCELRARHDSGSFSFVGPLSGFTTGVGINATFVPLMSMHVAPAGGYQVSIECNELDNPIVYFDARVAAVVLSTN
jgi:hypothetical protein